MPDNTVNMYLGLLKSVPSGASSGTVERTAGCRAHLLDPILPHTTAYRSADTSSQRDIPTPAEDIEPARGRMSGDADRLLIVRRERRRLSYLAAFRCLRQSFTGSGGASRSARSGKGYSRGTGGIAER